MGMNIEINEASERDIEVINNLVRFYVYDFTGYTGWDCPESGLFGGCDELPLYWGKTPDNPKCRWPEDWRGYPLLVRVDGKLAGFSLARRTPGWCSEDEVTRDVASRLGPLDFDMGQFFILRKFRRKGVGRGVAQATFDRFPGAWQIRALPVNTPAVAFWRSVVADYTGGRYEEFVGMADEYCGGYVVLRFDSCSGA